MGRRLTAPSFTALSDVLKSTDWIAFNRPGMEDLSKERASRRGETSTPGDSDFLENSLARKIAKDFYEDNIIIIDVWLFGPRHRAAHLRAYPREILF